MMERTVAEFGRLDAAFNNAGVMAKLAPTAESTLEEWNRVININLRGVWACLKHEILQMQKQGSGAIVNNASVGALTGTGYSFLHCLETRRDRVDPEDSSEDRLCYFGGNSDKRRNVYPMYRQKYSSL